MTEPSYYEKARALGASPALLAGIDILTDDGYPFEKAVSMLATAESTGRDPEAFARHMVKLRHAWDSAPSGPIRIGEAEVLREPEQ